MRPSGTDARGQATVELVLALPVIVLALLVVVQVALVARAQVLVVHAAREGARAAAVDPSPRVASGAVSDRGGLDPSRTRVHAAVSGSDPALVEVTVRYRAPTDVPLVGALVGDPVLEASVTMRVEEEAP